MPCQRHQTHLELAEHLLQAFVNISVSFSPGILIPCVLQSPICIRLPSRMFWLW